MKYLWKNEIYDVRLEEGKVVFAADGKESESMEVKIDGDRVSTPDGSFPFATALGRDGVWVTAGGVTAYLEYARPTAAGAAAQDEIRSPMTGKVVSVNVAPGDEVKEGDVLVVVTAMKMEFRIESPRDGVVEGVECEAEQLVDLGAILIRLKDDS